MGDIVSIVRGKVATVGGAAAFAILTAIAATTPIAAENSNELSSILCEDAGRWLDLAEGQRTSADRMFERLSAGDVVLLGETHTAREHHLWQLHTLAGLHARRSDLVIGFEMFPRSVQPTLDSWSRGALSRPEFLKDVNWGEVWGFDSGFYMPLFDFARQNRLPMRGLNVERGLVSEVGKRGWAAVPEEMREGVSTPAPASKAYREMLADVFLEKRRRARRAPSDQDTPTDEQANKGEQLAEIMQRDDFARFVEAQLTWDRAMAEGILAARRANPDALVVGVMGRGHVEFRYGVPHQLAALGDDDVFVLLPVERGEPCETLSRRVADAVFLVDRQAPAERAPAKPRLGVLIEPAGNGIRLMKVLDDSVAKAARLEVGDVIVNAAGVPVKRNRDLIDIVQRQAPGTWLPLEVQRGGESLEILAKFPASEKSVQ